MAIGYLLMPCANMLFVQSGPTLCDPMDCSPQGSSVHGILQAGILKWVTANKKRKHAPKKKKFLAPPFTSKLTLDDFWVLTSLAGSES